MAASSSSWPRLPPCWPPSRRPLPCGRQLPLLTATLAGALLFPLGRTLVESFDGSAPFFRRLAANAREPWDYARGAVIGAGVGLAVEIVLPTGLDVVPASATASRWACWPMPVSTSSGTAG